MRMQGRIKHGQSGFTLVELMIVIVVVGILASIAIPSYSSYLIRAKRTDAKTELLAVAQQLERCYTRTNTYNNADCTPALPRYTPNGAVAAKATYQITGEVAAQTFTLTATPKNGQASDSKCANFTLNQVGAKAVSGSMAAQQCWQGSGG